MAKKKFDVRMFAIVISVIIVVGVGGYFVVTQTALFQAQVGGFTTTTTTTTNVTAADWVSFQFLDRFSGKEIEDDVNVTPYFCSDISELTAEEADELRYSDFTADDLEANVDSGDKFDLDDDEYRVFLVEHPDCYPVWVYSYSAGVINSVELTNATAAVNILAYERDGGGITLNQTSDRYWTVQVKAQTADIEYTQGIPGLSWDFENYAWNLTGFRVLFNCTGKGSYVDITGTVSKGVAGNYTYCFMGDVWSSADWKSYTVNFAEGLGSLFEVISIEPVFGSLDGDVVAVGAAFV